MTGRSPNKAVMAQCAHLPGADLCFPFGDDVPVFKVAGKIFAILSLGVSPTVTLKCDPEEAAAWCRSQAGIVPGYHMNKRHWITVTLGRVDSALTGDLVRGSYECVVGSLPRGQRPIPV